jgi:hypothetical protein
MEGAAPSANVIADVRPDILIVPIFQTSLIVIVPVTLPAFVNVAVSWANGKLAAAGDPVVVVAHPVADQFCAPARFQYTVLAAGKVIPVFPPQSPHPTADVMVPTPTLALISLKSVLVMVRLDARFMFAVEPGVAHLMKLREIIDPVTDRTPLTVTVMSAAKFTFPIPVKDILNWILLNTQLVLIDAVSPDAKLTLVKVTL